MNGIYIHGIFLVISMLSVDCYVLRQATSDEFEVVSANPNPTQSYINGESLKRNNFPERIEKLMCLLRKHQIEEEELKLQIRQVLSGFRGPQNRDISMPQICQCKHRTVKDVLGMLNLTPSQSELLEKIVTMMQGRSCRHAGAKRKSNTRNIAATEKMRENAANKGDDDEIELNQNQLENIAYEVVKIIKRTPHLRNQLYRSELGKLMLPDGDTPPSEGTTAEI